MADTKEFNRLAEDYNNTKRKTLLNILECGKLLCEAKELLSHGQWMNWLQELKP